MNPDAPGTNSLGFRDREYPMPKPANRTRVVVLGDSFNWCGDLDCNHVDVVRKLVHRDFGDGIDVINVGIPMTHTGEQLIALRKWGLRFEPDLVILCFFAGNDFHDGREHAKRLVLNDCFYSIDDREERFLFGYPMVPKSRLLTYFAQKFEIGTDRRVVRDEDRPAAIPRFRVADTPEPALAFRGRAVGAEELRRLVAQGAESCPRSAPKPPLPRDTYLHLVARKMLFNSTEPEYGGLCDTRIEFILRKLDEMAALLAGRGIDFAVVVLPDEYQVSAELRRDAAEYGKRPLAAHQIDRQQRILRAHLAERGIACVDVLPVLRAAHEVRPAYHPRETHFNNFGNLAAGTAYYEMFVFDYLRRRLTGPGRPPRPAKASSRPPRPAEASGREAPASRRR